MADVIYDRIGVGYREHRRGDPLIAARIERPMWVWRGISELGRDG